MIYGFDRASATTKVQAISCIIVQQRGHDSETYTVLVLQFLADRTTAVGIILSSARSSVTLKVGVGG